jgi:hypothetical protein
MIIPSTGISHKTQQKNPAAIPPRPEVAVRVEVHVMPSVELKTRPLTEDTA